MVDTLCHGIKSQLDAVNQCVTIASVSSGTSVHADAVNAASRSNQCHDASSDEYALDDISGAELDLSQVKKARAHEVAYVRKMNLYTKVSIDECIKRTGKRPIAVKWIDVNKGDAKCPNCRSRLVGKEFNTYQDVTMFAATPPLEAPRTIIPIAATVQDRHALPKSIMTNDVSTAYFYAPVPEGQFIYVDLAPEDRLPGEENLCGRLNYSMYGTRKAATNWQQHYTHVLNKLNFRTGLSNPCMLHHKQRDIYTMVHGDDCASAASDKDLE